MFCTGCNLVASLTLSLFLSHCMARTPLSTLPLLSAVSSLTAPSLSLGSELVFANSSTPPKRLLEAFLESAGKKSRPVELTPAPFEIYEDDDASIATVTADTMSNELEEDKENRVADNLSIVTTDLDSTKVTHEEMITPPSSASPRSSRFAESSLELLPSFHIAQKRHAEDQSMQSGLESNTVKRSKSS